jgi:putative Holliday junction resolvase
MSSVISIDYGTHKSWLAYSVEGFAFAYRTVPTKNLIGEIEILLSQKNAKTIIIGMPYNIDGTLSRHGQRVKTFMKTLETHFPSIKIVSHDERLTTAEAKLEWAEDIDAESARLILAGYIEVFTRVEV